MMSLGSWLQGCTTYRPTRFGGGAETAQAPSTAAEAATHSSEPLARPTILPGRTYKLKWPASDHAIYVTLNDIVQEGQRRPFEIFINSKNMEHYAWTVALTRMISAVFRRGGEVAFVVEELKAVFDPQGGAWMEGRYVPSLLAAIGGIIEQHMIDTGFLPGSTAIGGHGAKRPRRPRAASIPAAGTSDLRQCPRCGSFPAAAGGATSVPPADIAAAADAIFIKRRQAGDAPLEDHRPASECLLAAPLAARRENAVVAGLMQVSAMKPERLLLCRLPHVAEFAFPGPRILGRI